MKILTYTDLLKLSISELESIDIDEYTDEEFANLMKLEEQLIKDLENNNIILENNNLTFEKLLNENRNK